jgi:diacylglycerol kinase (ATP)
LKPTLFIINPTSSFGKTLRRWTQVRALVHAHGIDFSEHLTSRAGEATEVAAEAIGAGVSQVVAVGGDGTLNEVVNGYLRADGSPINPSARVALLPSGTGSDFRRTLGLRGMDDAVSAIAGAASRMLDAVRIEFIDASGAARSRFFMNAATFGLGGEVARYVNLWNTKLPRWVGGRARFIAAAVRALESYQNRSVRILLDDEREIRVQTNLVVAANGRFAGGGMLLAPEAALDDGLLEVVLTDRATRIDVIKELPRIQRGGYLKNPKVSGFRARCLLIESWGENRPGASPIAASRIPKGGTTNERGTTNALPIDIDGEAAGTTPAKLTVLPGRIRFSSPPTLVASSSE